MSVQRRPREANNLFINFSLQKLNLADRHKHTRYRTPTHIAFVYIYIHTNIFNIYILYYCK